MLSSKAQMPNLDKSMRVMFTLCGRPSGIGEAVPINIDGTIVSTTDNKYFILIFFYHLSDNFKLQNLQSESPAC